MSNKAIIFDDNKNCIEDSKVFNILWNINHSDKKNIISISQIVNEDFKLYKNKYLDLIYKISKTSIFETSLENNLNIKDNFSYWQLTLLNEKSNLFKSTEINDVLKFLALKDWCLKKNIKEIFVNSKKPYLLNSIKKFCDNHGIIFSGRNYQSEKLNFFSYNFLKKKIKLFKAIIWLCSYLVYRFPLIFLPIKTWKSFSSDILFVSYFDNLIANTNEEYKSNYWDKLPLTLNQNNKSIKFLHLFAKDSVSSSPLTALRLLLKFSKSKLQSHIFLDSFLDLKTIIKSVNDYLFVSKNTYDYVSKLDSKFDSWPIISNDFIRSLNGPYCLKNLINFHLFNNAISCLNINSSCIYLQENQSWELSLIFNSKFYGLKRIIAYNHIIVGKWDFRFYNSHKVKNNILLPDIIAVNNTISKKYITQEYSRFPVKIIDLEALRYLKFIDFKSSKNKFSLKTILICGEFSLKRTESLLNSLDSFLNSLEENINVFFKPHPNTTVIPKNSRIQIRNNHLYELLKISDILFTTSSTNAVVDSYYLKVPTVCLTENFSFNVSPFINLKSIYYINSNNDLNKVIDQIFKSNLNHSNEFLFLDKKISKWKNLLLKV